MGAQVSNAHIHPAFAGMLDSFSSMPNAQREADLGTYRAMLKAHDWLHELSDDHQVYSRGRDQRMQLIVLAEVLDKDRAIWNSVAPDNCRWLVAA